MDNSSSSHGPVTDREYTLAYIGSALMLLAIVCAAARFITTDTSLNSLLFIGIAAVTVGTLMLLRAGRHI